jgi:hypothetical protein
MSRGASGGSSLCASLSPPPPSPSGLTSSPARPEPERTLPPVPRPRLRPPRASRTKPGPGRPRKNHPSFLLPLLPLLPLLLLLHLLLHLLLLPLPLLRRLLRCLVPAARRTRTEMRRRSRTQSGADVAGAVRRGKESKGAGAEETPGICAGPALMRREESWRSWVARSRCEF